MNAYHKAYQQSNRERVNQLHREWNARHPEVYLNKSRRARKEKPQYYLDIEKRYRKKQLQIGSKRCKSAIWYAVKTGRLKRLSTEFVKCSDCNARATMYDHRDYNKPFDVDPVCGKCNRKRGPAIALQRVKAPI